MFESWVSELLASYLGHFVDIQKEQLRVSLWSAWKSGVTLQHVKLKVEAFDYLQLPVDIKEGVVGRLQVQVPWHPFTGRLLQIALSDVYLRCGPREEADWEEGPARRRAEAAERAELSALEVQQQSETDTTAGGNGATSASLRTTSNSSASSSSSSQANRWGLWTLCWQLGRIVLNRLQLTVNNVHLTFQEPPGASDQHGTQLGVRLREMRTGKAEAGRALSPAAPSSHSRQDASISSFLVVSQLSCYWRPAVSGLAEGALSASVDPRGPNAVLQPVDCSLSIKMHTLPGGASVVEAASVVNSVNVQLHQQQVADIARLSDAASIWKLRAKYAAIRPTGWRSNSDHSVPWWRVWQYAAKAVLADVNIEGRPGSLRNRDRLAQRRQYISLYQRKLHLARRQEASDQQLDPGEKAQMAMESDAIAELESRFTAEDTRLFRVAAERTLPEPPVDDAEPTDGASQRGWMQWGLSTAAGYLGYLPRQAPLSQALPKPPTEAEMQELLRAMDLDGPAPGNANAEHSQDMRFTFHLTVKATSLLLSETLTPTKRLPIVRVETRGCNTVLQMQPDKLSLDFDMADITALDLCAHGPGIAEVILTRALAEAEPPMAAGFTQAADAAEDEEKPPVLHLAHTMHLGQGPDAGANIVVEVQPLQLTYQPQALSALSAFLGGMPSDTHSSAVLAAINALDNPVARTLAKARKAWSPGPGNSLTIQIENLVVLTAGLSASAEDPCAVLHTGRLEVSNVAPPKLAARSKALQWLLDNRTQVHGGVSKDSAQQLERIIDTLLTDRYRLQLGALSAGIAPSQRAAASGCNWALQPVDVAVGLRVSRMGGDSRLTGLTAEVQMGSVAVALSPRTLAMLRTSLTYAPQHDSRLRQPQQQHAGNAADADVQPSLPASPDEQVPSAVLGVAAKGLDIRYDDDQPSFPDATNTHLRFTSGAAALHAQQLHGCKRAKVTVKHAAYSDASVHELSPPQIRGVIPRLGARISAQQLDIRVDDSSATGQVMSFGLHGLKGQGFAGESGNFVKPCQATKPAVLLVTVHKFPGGIHTAVNIHDGCFGTTTVMRIASMFVPHNIFQERGPDGARISREHPLEVATVARPTAPATPVHSPQHQHDDSVQPSAEQLPRPYSAPTLAECGEAGDATRPPPAATSPSSRVLQLQSPSLNPAANSTAQDPHSDAASGQQMRKDYACSSPASAAGSVGQQPQLRVATPAAAAVSPFAATAALDAASSSSEQLEAASSEPPPPQTPPHSPPRVSHSLERVQPPGDGDSFCRQPSGPAASQPAEASADMWAASPEAHQASIAAAVGEADERVAAAEAGHPQQEADAPDPKHPPGGHDQFSIAIRNCRMLGPGLPHSLASGGIGAEQIIRELMPQDNQDAAIRLDMPQLLLRLPVAAPPEHPERHPAQEPLGTWSDYARRPGGAFAPPPAAEAAPTLPMTLCSATNVALYLAADGGEPGNIARKLPVLLLPSLRLATTELRRQQLGANAAANAPQYQPAAFVVQVAAIEAALQPRQLHTALTAQAAATQDWERICGSYVSHEQQDTVSSQLGGADLLSAASVDGSAASAPAATTLSMDAARRSGVIDAGSAGSDALIPHGAPSAASSSGSDSPTAAQQLAEEAVGFSESDRWSLCVEMPSLVAHLYSAAHQTQPSVTLELSGLTAEYEQTGGSAMGRHGSVRFVQLLLQLHDSLQEAALRASLAAASAMQGPASPSKASLATSKSTDPEDHSTQGGGPASSAPGLRRRSGSMSAARRTASSRRGSRPAQRNSSRLTDLSAAASSGLHAALLPLHRGTTSSEDSDELGPLHRFGSMGMSGLGYGGSGSGLLHAQSSTINLSAGQPASSGDDFYDIEDDAASYFSATSNLLSSGGGGGGQGELPPFSHLPNSAETSTLDLLLVMRRGDGISSADGTSAAAAAGQAPSTAGHTAAGDMPQTPGAAAQQGSGGSVQHLAITFDGGYALPGTALQLRRSRVVCAGLLLRAYTEGWWIAVACVQQYYAVVQGAVAKQQQEVAVAYTADGDAAVDIAGPSLELDFSGWLLEVVATGGTGPILAAPALTLELAAAVALRSGQLVSVRVPAVVLHVALAEPDYDITRCATDAQPLGALAGLAGLSVELADPAGASAFSASADRLSVWAQSRKLYTAAAFAHTLQSVLKAHPGKEASTPAAPAEPKSSSAKVTELLRRLPSPAQLQLRRAALYLADDVPDDETILFEAALDDLTVCVQRDAAEELHMLSMQVTLLANVFNHGCMGWEPVLEPWTVTAQLESALPAQHSSSGSQAAHHKLGLEAKEMLDITASLTGADAAALTLSIVSGVQQLASGELHLDDALARATRPELVQQSPYWVKNETGATVTIWLASGLQAAPASAPADAVQVGPGQGMALPLESGSQEQPGPRMAGDPAILSSATRRLSVDSSAAAAAEHALIHRRSALDSQQSDQAAGRQQGSQQRTMLFFQLSGHELACGPIPLEGLSTASQTVEVRPTGSVSSAAAAWVRLVAAVQPRRHGGYTLQLHSGICLRNATDMPLQFGWRSAHGEATVIEEVEPSDTAWLPVMPITSGELTLRPAVREDDEPEHIWAEGIRLPPLLQALAPGSAALTTRHLLCPAIGAHSAIRLSLGAAPVPNGGGVMLQIRPPLLLDNALPMPLGITVWDGDTLLTSAYVRPREQLSLHQVDPSRLEALRLSLQPSGYESTPRIALPQLQVGPVSSAAADAAASSGEAHIQVREEAKARGTSTLMLRRVLEATSGCTLLHFTCALWVYNCSGLPLALQKSEVEELADYGALDIADSVPVQWLPPFEGAAGGHAVSAAAPVPSRAPSMRSTSPTTTAVSDTNSGTATGSRGLRQVLPPPPGAGRIRPLEPLVSPQRGMAESMDYMPAYRMPARWPSMIGTLAASPNEPLRVQVRASPYKATEGSSYWSEPLQLDALGAAAVVTVPAPLQGLASGTTAPNAAVVVSVTARQVSGGGGAVAVHVMPRYVLHNLLDVPLQCKQAGTAVERELTPGVPAALHWPDMKLPLALSLRVREAGWLWSGAIGLDTPGDQFCKIRHRDRGVTMLVRVDISADTNGVLSVALSHQAAGFAPYRIDNCTAATLHLRQAKCSHASDVLRPYSALDYAWDEPGLPHTLLVELPGSRSLGAFDLDKVGVSTQVALPGNARQGVAETPVQVAVRAEGPTRVVTISDLAAHLPLPLGAAAAGNAAGGGGGGWEPWSGHDPVAVLEGPEAAQQRRTALLGLLAEVRLDAAGIGLSVVDPKQELLYASATGIRARCTASSGRLTLELAVKGVQADNAQPDTQYPVMLVLPRPPAQWPRFKRAISSVAPAASSRSRATAVTMRLAVWRRRPGGVLCVEELDLALAPLALAVEQQHAVCLVEFAHSAAEPFSGSQPGRQGRGGHEPALGALSGGASRASAAQQKVYIERAVLSSIDASLSFVPAPWTASRPAGGGPLARMLGLAQVEGGRVVLAPLVLRHPLLGGAALQQLVSRHYTRAALPQLFKLAASADVFGDPRRLLHHLGLGVWSFLAEPAAGLLRTTRGGGIRRLPEGVLAGTSALIGNTVFAFANASTKMLSSARQSLLVAGLDRPQPLPAPPATGEAMALERRLTVPPDVGQAGFMGALLNGVAGLLSEPIRGVSEGGAGGLARGAVRGATGALVRPLAAALEASATFADNIRKAVGGGGGDAVRRRPPRWVDPVRALQAYSWRQAAGRLLLRRLRGGAYQAEGFAGCVPLAPPHTFIVATCEHVLHVSGGEGQAAPVLHWASAAEDLVHLARDGARVQLLAMAPEKEVSLPHSPSFGAAAASAVALQPAPGRGDAATAAPFFSAMLQCANEQDAAALQELLESVRQQAVPRRAYVGHGLVVHTAYGC